MNKHHIFLFLMIGMLGALTGCKTSYKSLYRQQVSQAEAVLGIDIAKSDPLHLYLEAASWVGTPYRSGGATRRGTDCSGFTYSIYRDVYQKRLSRTSAEMYYNNCVRIRRKSKLKSGDLVFFRTGRDNRINHVGIYLKNNYFIHSAVRGGVRVDRLDEPYYKKTFYRSGRVK